MAGHVLAQFLPSIERALISTATRAQQTWDLARTAVEVEQVKNVPELYLASADAMLRRVRAVEADSLLLVAHNPGIEVLAERLSRDTRTPTYRRMMTKFPTAAFAVLRDDRPFSEWGYGTADLVTFEVARG